MALGTSLPQRMALSTGTVYYVGRINGNDANTTTQAQTKTTPWKTINGALTALQTASSTSNAIIKVIPDGEYTEIVNVSAIRPASPLTICADYTTVMGDGGSKPRISFPYGSANGFKFSNCTNIRLAYLNFQGDGDNTGNPLKDSGVNLIGPTGGPSDSSFGPNFGLAGDDSLAAISGATGAFEVDHCDFLDCYDQGLYAGGNNGATDVNDLHVRYCTFKRVGRAMTYNSSNQNYYWPGHTHALYLHSCWRPLILNCTISDVPAGNCVQFYPEVQYGVVAACTIVSAMRNAVVLGDESGTRATKGCLVVNNNFSNLPALETIGSAPAFPGSTGASSTFTTQNPGNFGYGAGVDWYWGGTTGTGHYVKNNNFWHVNTPVSSGGGITVSGTVATSPGYRSSYDGTTDDGSGSIYNGASTMFPHGGGVSKIWSGPDHSSGRDLSLTVGSPLLAGALDVWLPALDMAGTARTGLTIGAYETSPSGGGGGGGFVTPARVQQVISYAGSAGEASHVFTTGVAVAQGHHLVFTVGLNINGTTVSSISDSKGNSYQVDVVTTGSANGEEVVICSGYMAAALTAADTITVTSSNSSATMTVYADEWSGLAATGWLDKTAVQEQAGVSSPSSGATAATTQATELVVGATIYAGSHAPTTAGAGFTIRNADLIPGGTFVRTQSSEYQVVTATGAQTATFTVVGTSNTETAVATYKAAAAPAAVAPTLALLGVGT